MQVCGIMGKYKWETLLLFISNKPVTVAIAFVLSSKHKKVLGFLGGLLFSSFVLLTFNLLLSSLTPFTVRLFQRVVYTPGSSAFVS